MGAPEGPNDVGTPGWEHVDPMLAMAERGFEESFSTPLFCAVPLPDSRLAEIYLCAAIIHDVRWALNPASDVPDVWKYAWKYAGVLNPEDALRMEREEEEPRKEREKERVLEKARRAGEGARLRHENWRARAAQASPARNRSCTTSSALRSRKKF